MRHSSQISDENAICVVWSDDLYFMMLRHDFFNSFGGRPIAEPAEFTQVPTAFRRSSREEVDAIVRAGLAAGGKETSTPQDYGYMYSRSLDDPDGNILEFFTIDMEVAAVAMGAP